MPTVTTGFGVSLDIDVSQLVNLGATLGKTGAELQKAVISGIKSGAYFILKRLKTIAVTNEFGWPAVSRATAVSSKNPPFRGRRVRTAPDKKYAFGGLRSAILYKVDGDGSKDTSATIGLIPGYKPNTAKVKGVLSDWWGFIGRKLQAGWTESLSWKRRRYYFAIGLRGLGLKRQISVPARPFFGKAAGVVESQAKQIMFDRVANRMSQLFAGVYR